MSAREEFHRTAFIGLSSLLSAMRDNTGLTAEDIAAMTEADSWVRAFLCRPHEQLGREGEVCPYSRLSVDLGRVYLAVCRTATLADPRAEVMAMMRSARAFWDGLSPAPATRAMFSAVLVLFPELPAAQHQPIIDSVQRELSLEFTRDGLMIGEFYPTCQVRGIHNPAFRPMQSPGAMLAIRRMVQGDLPFLWGSDAKIEGYMRQFGEAGRRMIEVQLLRADQLPADVAARLRRYVDRGGPSQGVLK